METGEGLPEFDTAGARRHPAEAGAVKVDLAVLGDEALLKTLFLLIGISRKTQGNGEKL